MYGNTPGWKNLDLNGIGYFTQMYIKDNSGGSGTESGKYTSSGNSPENALLSKSHTVCGTGIGEDETKIMQSIIMNL